MFKNDIKEFKKENGNVIYSIKELLYVVHKKIDRLSDKIQGNDKRFNILETEQAKLETRIHKKLLYWLFTIGSTIIGGAVIAIITTLL